jgi:hypothetical protein
MFAGRAVYHGRGMRNEDTNPPAAALDSALICNVRKLADQIGDFDRDGVHVP